MGCVCIQVYAVVWFCYHVRRRILHRGYFVLHMTRRDLKPLFKWTGGKRREIKLFEDYYPDFVKDPAQEYTFVEPFVGGGAVFWSLNNQDGHNVINDFETELINFYRQMKEQSPGFIDPVREVSALWEEGKPETTDSGEVTVDNYAQRSEKYYEYRNMDKKGGLAGISDEVRAARFFIVNQLSFSGMRRFNAAGEFNVPFGHYKNFNSALITSPEHVDLLKNTEMHNSDYREVIEDNDEDNTFIFLDPPYTRVMKKYSHEGEFEEDKQRELAGTLASLEKASFMVVIDKSDLTMELYSDYVKHTYDVNYGVNIKNRFSQGSEHIVATNYTPTLSSAPASSQHRTLFD